MLGGLLIAIGNSISTYLFGELSIFKSYLFSCTFAFLSFIFTYTKRTENARFAAIIFVTLEFLVENFILNQTFYQNKANLIKIIWLSRYLFIVATVLALAYHYFNYNDFNKSVIQSLNEIKNQNIYLMGTVERLQEQFQNCSNFQRYLSVHYDNYRKQKACDSEMKFSNIKAIKNEWNKYF